jgi:hypothetical protein
MSRRALTILLTALGVLLLAAQVASVGLDAITDGIRRMGVAGLALILIVSVVRQLLRSAAWVLLMRDDARVPLGRALAATIAGDAVGNLTPLSLAASEPAKAMLVGAHMPPPRALAALAAENFFYSVSVAIAVLGGVAVLFVAFPQVPEPLRTASLVLVAMMAGVLIAALWLIAKQPALVSSMLARFTGLAGAKAPAYTRFIDKIRTLETSSYAFVRAKPGRLAGVVLCETSFHLFSVAETWITLGFLGYASGLTYASLALAFVLDTVQRVINVVFRIVPLKLGVDEVGSGFTTAALDLGATLGVQMSVIRKIRVLFWAVIGLAILGVSRSRAD